MISPLLQFVALFSRRSKHDIFAHLLFLSRLPAIRVLPTVNPRPGTKPGEAITLLGLYDLVTIDL
jgi:hypothetical protein